MGFKQCNYGVLISDNITSEHYGVFRCKSHKNISSGIMDGEM